MFDVFPPLLYSLGFAYMIILRISLSWNKVTEGIHRMNIFLVASFLLLGFFIQNRLPVNIDSYSIRNNTSLLG